MPAVVIATWPFGQTAVRTALPLLRQGRPALDAALAGAQAVEDDPTVDSDTQWYKQRPKEERRQESGARRQEGEGRQEAAARSQETGDRRQEAQQSRVESQPISTDSCLLTPDSSSNHDTVAVLALDE